MRLFDVRSIVRGFAAARAADADAIPDPPEVMARSHPLPEDPILHSQGNLTADDRYEARFSCQSYGLPARKVSLTEFQDHPWCQECTEAVGEKYPASLHNLILADQVATTIQNGSFEEATDLQEELWNLPYQMGDGWEMDPGLGALRNGLARRIDQFYGETVEGRNLLRSRILHQGLEGELWQTPAASALHAAIAPEVSEMDPEHLPILGSFALLDALAAMPEDSNASWLLDTMKDLVVRSDGWSAPAGLSSLAAVPDEFLSRTTGGNVLEHATNAWRAHRDDLLADAVQEWSDTLPGVVDESGPLAVLAATDMSDQLMNFEGVLSAAEVLWESMRVGDVVLVRLPAVYARMVASVSHVAEVIPDVGALSGVREHVEAFAALWSPAVGEDDESPLSSAANAFEAAKLTTR